MDWVPTAATPTRRFCPGMVEMVPTPEGKKGKLGALQALWGSLSVTEIFPILAILTVIAASDDRHGR